MKISFQVLAEKRLSHLILMALVIFFSRMLLISKQGWLMPFFDDWHIIGYKIFKPYLEGSLRISDLVAGANEHRAFFTRVAWLVALELSGFWDNILMSIFNSLINLIGLLIIITQILKPLSDKSANILILMFTVLLSLPIVWTNTVWGIQSCVYFVILFSCISLYLCITSETLSNRWLAGIFFGICAFFSFANGSMVFPVIFLFSFLRMYFKLEERWRSAIGCIICIIVFVVLVQLTPTIDGHGRLRAHNVSDFVSALLTVLSWPAMKWRIHSIFLWAPTVALAIHLFKKGFRKENNAVVLLAFSVWVFLVDSLFAYGRALDPANVRYVDFIMLGLLTNTASAFVLIEKLPKGSFKRNFYMTGAIAILVWLSAWIVKWVEKADRTMDKWKNDWSVNQIANVKGYMLTGDSAFLYPARKIHVPYRSQDLKQYLSIDLIRGTLPGEFGSTEVERGRSIEKTVLKGALSGVTREMKELLLKNPFYFLLFFGIIQILLFLSLIWGIIKNPIGDSKSR